MNITLFCFRGYYLNIISSFKANLQVRSKMFHSFKYINIGIISKNPITFPDC